MKKNLKLKILITKITDLSELETPGATVNGTSNGLKRKGTKKN